MRHYEVVIVGGGHNALVAAGYLAKAEKSVLVIERLDYLGGAATSSYTFEGVAAKLSRYSYLVSLLPKQIIEDLGLDISLAPRRYSSFTPDPAGDSGLLIDRSDAERTEASFRSVGAESDFEAWGNFYGKTERLAKVLFPTLTKPLQKRSEIKAAIGADFAQFFERPIGELIESEFSSDLVRGVALTDALIGTHAPNLDANLDANRCFLYHVIGGGTGDWNIPVGGMGAVSGSMANAAKSFGAQFELNATVTSITKDKVVHFQKDGAEHSVQAEWVLSGVSQTQLAKLTGALLPEQVSGAQVKINMLLSRLPKLKDPGISAAEAFGGTFHINENYSQLQSAFDAAAQNKIPEPVPCEIYCHSLTDPSILSPELQQAGAQTLTVFALHLPHHLVAVYGNDNFRDLAQAAILRSLNSVLAEPIEELIMKTPTGEFCIETKTTQDLEDALGLPGGNIFHSPLSWPFVEDHEVLDTPAKRWGVDSGIEGVLFCGSSAKRGGAVSGIGGHNAAMAILES